MSKRLKVIIAICAVLTVITATLAVCCTLSYKKASESVTVTCGDIPDYSHITHHPVLSRMCKITTDTSSMDTSTQGKTSVSIIFLGIWEIRSEVNIVPPSIPDLVSREVCITRGTEISADMFVVSPTDIEVSFRENDFDINTEGEYEVKLSAVREGDVPTKFTSKLTVYDPGDLFTFEYGRSTGAVIKNIHSKFREIDKLDATAVGPSGRFPVKCYNETTFFLFEVTMLKATAGDGKVLSFDIIAGDKVTKEDILGGMGEENGITAEFSDFPDFNVPGDHEIRVTLTNIRGDIYEQVSHIRVHDINRNITAELQSSNEELAALIFKDTDSARSLKFGNDFVSEFMEVGENNIFLHGEYSTVTVKAHLCDTIAPIMVLNDIKYPVGHKPSAERLVKEYTDASKVTFTFEGKIDFDKEGAVKVCITATDEGGNVTKGNAKINFVKDTEPPKIYGASNMTVAKDSSPKYGGRVYAEDELVGRVTVAVDSSQVNTQKYGTYNLTYYATDLSGNTATVNITVTVADKATVQLDVKNIMQYPALPNGCEVTSLAIVLNYLGYEVDPVWLCDNHLPIEDFVYGDPWKTYVGNPKNEGLGCYAPAIVQAGNSYLESVDSEYRVKNVSGGAMGDYEGYIDRGVPVILWGTMYMNCDPEVYWRRNYDGREVVWHASSHCLVLIGYTSETYIFCDPMRSGIVEYSRESVEKSSEINFRQACVIE